MLTQSRLKALIHYDHLTGSITHKKKKHKISSTNDGYVSTAIDGESYLIHRLAFMYMEGYFPEHEVDHKNGICDDNRWKNLRHVSTSCNMQNTKKYSSNKTGFPGTYMSKKTGMFIAEIRINSKNHYLGSHSTAIDAALARLTGEVWSESWKCNYRGVLVSLIKDSFPNFNNDSMK